MIFLQLDPSSLIRLRRVNRATANLLDNLGSDWYRAVTEHGRTAAQAIHATYLDEMITVKMLYDTMCTRDCERCGDFGGFIYLLTCQRVCFACFTSDWRYLPLQPQHAARKYGIKRQVIATHFLFEPVVRDYTPSGRRIEEGALEADGPFQGLVDHEAARAAGLARHGSQKAMERHVARSDAKRQASYAKRIDEMWPPGWPTPPATGDPVDRGVDNPFRFAAIIRAPWFNRNSKEAE